MSQIDAFWNVLRSEVQSSSHIPLATAASAEGLKRIVIMDGGTRVKRVSKFILAFDTPFEFFFPLPLVPEGKEGANVKRLIA